MSTLNYPKFAHPYIEFQVKAPEYTAMAKPVLIDFATCVWGKPSFWPWSWSWSIKPSTDIQTYGWVGTVTKKDVYHSSAPIDANGRFSVVLEKTPFGHFCFRIMAFQEYGYHRQNTLADRLRFGVGDVRAIYVMLTEVNVWTGISTSSLQSGLIKLHTYLRVQPVKLMTKGYEAPKSIDTRLSPDIRLTSKAVDKYD